MHTTRRRAAIVALLTLFAAGCQTALESAPVIPDVVRPDRYEGGGVIFGYPGNWSLVDHVGDTPDGEVRNISVGLPGVGGAYMRVFSPPPPDLDFDAFKQAFASQVEARVPSALRLSRVEEAPVETVVAGAERAGSRRDYTFRVFTAVFRMSLEFHRVDVADRSVFLVTLASGDAENTDDGFDLIKRSLSVQSGTYLGDVMREFRREDGRDASPTHDLDAARQLPFFAPELDDGDR